MNLNIDDFGGKSVVPVFCGGYVSGTGFFVSRTKLLTAGHVLAEYILDKEAIVAVLVEGDYKVCRVLFNYHNPDVAVLECVDYQCREENVLKLLDCKFQEGVEALIVGYPRELGNGEDYFGITVKNTRNKKDLKGGFDRVVVRTDSFGFNSYDGFSGSPVINDFGLVMGIETDQLYNTLGYVSVNAIKPYIESLIDARIEENDELYDNTAYGLWTSRNHLLTHTSVKLKTRYNHRVHIENATAEAMIKSFCGYGLEDERINIQRLFIVWYSKLAGTRRDYVDSIQVIGDYRDDGIITEDLIDAIDDLFYLRDRDIKLPSDYRKELKFVYRKMLKWLSYKELDDDKQFLYVSGSAGCGKSHLLYYLADKMAMSQHIYMFLGSEFSPLEDPESTIAGIMKWKNPNPLEHLNREMHNKGVKKATIIIDALNEGAGTYFWVQHLPILKSKIAQYKRLKLIVSLRNISEKDQLNDILRDGWERLNLEGFADRKVAIKEYFKEYDINSDRTVYEKIEEFSNPLFLKMFCETFYSQSEEERDKVLRLPIYKQYLKKRNDEVSHNIDEDEKQNIAGKFIMWVARRSVYSFNCEDLPRQLAYRHSQRICPNRSWTHSLLNNILEANLLHEYYTKAGDYVGFEFESMGDYLKADQLLEKKCSDLDRFNDLLSIFSKMNDNYDQNENWQKQFNFIRAFLSVWNPPMMIWQKPDFISGRLTSILLSSLHLRSVRDNENTLTPTIIGSILNQNPDYLDPKIMLLNVELYSQGLIDYVHNKLLAMTMSDRDLQWTTKVNKLFDGEVYLQIIEDTQSTLLHEVEALLIIETWMLSSSYPYLRAYLIRQITRNLLKNPYIAHKLIELFYSVDDPYILEGLYAAVYGVAVKVDRAPFSQKISSLLYTRHYDENGKAPQDLMVRHWTLKLFEFAAHQDSSIDIWQKAQPPYAVSEDIFLEMPNENYSEVGYFGNTYGGKQITRSLFHWDFSRYIIGGGPDSMVFFRDNNPVKIIDIENAIAYLIKHRFGWNDELGKYDADVPYQIRSENSMERIGKKYQWIGMYKVYAYLCDTCQMKINIWSAREQFAKRNYPWYAPEHNYFDPTLVDDNLALQESHKLFEVIHPESMTILPAKEWLEDESEMPPLYFEIDDRKGDKWIPLLAYSTITQRDGDEQREYFVFYNGFFVSNKQYVSLRAWAETSNFYGRWMPEHNGSIDFLWTDFPWADSYRILEEEENEPFVEEGIEMVLAYSAQLQEDFKGMNDENQYLTTAYAPCCDMMRMLNLHTAERGVILDRHGSVVAINRDIPDDSIRALLVRKDILDYYLQEKGLVLFWSLVGEKQYGKLTPSVVIKRLTGASAYIPGEGVDRMQPLRIEPTNRDS